MKIIEITETKMDKLSGHIEQGLRHLGKAMQCVDEWMQEGGNRSRGGSMGYRDDEEEWEMQERRRRDSRGRYM